MNHQMEVKPITAWIAGLLCAVILFCVPARAVGAADPWDYGRNTAGDVALRASELFTALYGDSESALTAGEREALDALADVTLRYNRSIPTGMVDRVYDGDTGIFTVIARQYDYVAVNGKTVSWVPVTVSMAGGDACRLEAAEEPGVFVYRYDNMWHSDEIQLTVDFVWRVEIPVETADGLLTLPYTVGSDALSQITQYETDQADHLARVQAYAAYLQACKDHAFATAEYERYDAETEIYLRQCDAYARYQAEMEQYQASIAHYQENEARKKAYEELEKKYFEYQTFLTQNAILLDQYDRYTNDMAAVQARLCIMESMFLTDSHGWQFYSGVMGGTVDQVLSRRKELITVAGVDSRDLDKANDATVALRPLLQGYADVRSAKYKNELERTRAEFAYYSAHYEEIRVQLTALYEALYMIYHANGPLQTAMETKLPDKIEHFRQFMGQLYVLRCALNGQMPDSTWTLTLKKYTVPELVEEALWLNGSVAAPGKVVVPEQEVVLKEEDIPERVEFLPEKDYDSDMKEPEKPAPVSKPGKEPVKPTVERPGALPAEVPEPSEPPVAPKLRPEARALAEELRTGVLPERAARGSAQVLEIHREVTVTKYIDNRKTVTFYDHEGHVLQVVTVEYGQSAAQLAPKPNRATDERYEYTFLGWSRLGGGSSAFEDLYVVTEDLSLFPRYDQQTRFYQVTWEVNGNRQTQWLPWGEMPACTLSTERAGDSATVYTFAGWMPEVAPVSGTVTYTAQYDVSPRMYEITWELGDRTLQSTCAYGTVPVCPVDPDLRAADDHVYVFLGWNREPQAAVQDATYRARYRSTALATEGDGSVCSVTHTADAVILHAKHAAVQFDTASAYARAQGKQLVLQWGSLSVALDASSMKALDAAFCVRLECVREQGSTPEAEYFCLRALNSIGQEVAYSKSLQATWRYTPIDGMTVAVYRVSGNKLAELPVSRYAGGTAEFSVPVGTRMLRQPEYALRFVEPTGNCNLSALPKRVPAGGEIRLDARCTYGYEIVAAVAVSADGTRETLDVEAFTMPAQAITVELQVERIVYRVTFVVDGVVISEQELFFGEEVAVPEDPFKAEDDTYIYTFAGWSPYVTKATGEDRSPVYTASFTHESKVSGYLPGQNVNRFLIRVLPVILLVAVLVIAAVILVRFRRELLSLSRRLFRKQPEKAAELLKDEPEDDMPVPESSSPDAETATETDILPDTETETETDIQPESETVSETETETETQADAEPEVGSDENTAQ